MARHVAPTCGYSPLNHPPLQGFDGYKWLSDLHVLDVGKLEEGAITSARCVAEADCTPVRTSTLRAH